MFQHEILRAFRYIFSLALLWATTFALANAQSLPIKFKHFSYKEGLVQSPISSFLQDDDGFIWFGNLKGLTRYDGYKFKTYIFDQKQPKSLSNNRVNILFKDVDKNLWIGTANGVNLYNRNDDNFTAIDVREVKGGRNYISSIVQDRQKNLWIGTFGGLKKLNRKTQKLEDLNTDKNDPEFKNSAIFSLFVDRNNQIWAGTKTGLRKFDPATGKTVPLPAVFATLNEMPRSRILVIRQDFDGNLWFGTEVSGVFSYNPQANAVQQYLSSGDPNSISSDWIKDILVYDRNNIWFATRNGLSTLNLQTNKFANYRHDPLNDNSLNDDAIWSLMKDKNACVWIGTFSGVINFYYAGNSNFQNIGERIGNKLGLNHILVNGVVEDHDGSLWVGTSGGGLNHIDRKAKTSSYYPIGAKNNARPSNGVKSMADDKKGSLWIGSLDGLSLFNKSTKQFKYYEFPVRDGKLSENLILSILPYNNGAWIGTNGGGLRYVLHNGQSPILLRKDTNVGTKGGQAISDNFVTALLEDEQHNIWVGTQNGLNYYDVKLGKMTKLYRKIRNSKPYQISNSNITTLFIDSKQQLWVGTEGGGLNYFDQKNDRFYAISKDLGLGDDVIHAILEDDLKNIWISTDLGLYKLVFKKQALPFSKENLSITSYTSNDGLISSQFSTQAGIRLKTGEIVFGGINGVSIFYPERIIKNSYLPKVALTNLLVNNKEVAIGAKDSPLSQSITQASSITVPYDQSNLSIEFSALNFINSENNQYAYKLEGLPAGDEWQPIGKQRVVNFANLAPGNYVFKVKAANNDGIWSSFERTIKIKVLPPWYQTWWAMLIYAVILFLIGRTIYVFLKNRATLKRELYLEQVQNERQEELHQMKIDFFTNISHEIRTPLTLILGPLEKMVLNSGAHTAFYKQLLQVQHNANRLMRLVTELMDFRKAESGHMKLAFSNCNLVKFAEEIYLSFQNLAEDKRMAYEFVCAESEIMVYFDKDHFEKVLFNLLSNAFKFTPEGGKISFVIRRLADSVSIAVTDNGKGISPKNIDKLFNKFFQVYNAEASHNGYGIGLALSKSIVELHKGTIEVSSEAETTFTVSLPLGSAHLDQSLLLPEYMNSDNPVHYYLQSQANTILTAETPAVQDLKYTLLVIEDNQELRSFIKESFHDQYRVLQAANGADGLDVALAHMPDLIISDVMMPEMDGLELCRRVKSDERINHIPVVLLTARAAYIHQINGLEKGADAYITKPFSIQVLGLNIKNILATKEAGRQKMMRDVLLNPQPLEIVSPDEKFIGKLMAIIERHLDDPEFDVGKIVQEVGMSKTVLYKKVQALTSLSVADLIKSIRLKKAAMLLENNQLSIAEIAFSVGFSDRKYFSKEFKKQYSCSPSEYIAMHAKT